MVPPSVGITGATFTATEAMHVLRHVQRKALPSANVAPSPDSPRDDARSPRVFNALNFARAVSVARLLWLYQRADFGKVSLNLFLPDSYLRCGGRRRHHAL
jgi:hypothetical protein